MGEARKMKTGTKVLLGSVVLVGLWFAAPPLFGPAQEATPPNSGGLLIDIPGKFGGGKSSYSAPDFTVSTFENERFHLASNKGTPVVLNFWESW